MAEQEKPRAEGVVIENTDTHAIIFTGNQTVIDAVGFQPIIDTHVHIESNNCAPMTLQWGLTNRILMADRKGLNDLTTGTNHNIFLDVVSFLICLFKMKDMARVGRQSTNMIAQLLMEDSNQLEIKSDLYWTFITKEDKEKLETLRKQQEESLEKDEKTELSDKEKRELERLSGKVAKMEKKVMDEIANQLSGLKDMVKNRIKSYGRFHANAAYYFGKKKIFNIFIPLPMDLSYGHFWGQYGFPVYLADYDREGKITCYYYFNDFLEAAERITNNRYNPVPGRDYKMLTIDSGIDLEKHKKLFLLEGLSQTANEAALKKYNTALFKHFVEMVPGENTETFEDYERQMMNTREAAVLYPFQILPFCKYDPRRHNPDRIKADEVGRDHLFFTYRQHREMIGSRSLTVSLDITKKSFDLTNLFTTNKDTNKEVFTKVYSDKCANGPYWGFKMYTKLGFAPWDFTTYPEMEDFFKQCIEHDLPVTCHCSYGGMTIADMNLYQEDAKQRAKNNRLTDREKAILNDSDKKTRFDFTGKDDKERYVNQVFVNPLNWKKVLDTPGLEKLRFCFAHAGSWEIWSDQWGTGKYHDWTDTVTRLVGEKENVYADLAYFINWWYHQTDAAAKSIAKACSNKKFKEHILFGSDWYMYEMDGEGIGDFYRRMFRMLKKVSEYAQPQFDAWYQFSVINPLRFLGLIEDGGTSISSRGKTKLENHLNYINNALDDPSLRKRSKIETAEEANLLKNRAAELMNVLLTNIRLEEADRILDTNNRDSSRHTKLLILRDPDDKDK